MIAICGLWLSQINQGLWLDELLSAWVSSSTFSDTFDRANHAQASTPFYFLLLWAIRQVFGSSELALRTLSLILSFTSIALVYRIARGLIEREAAFFAAIVFVCSDGVINAAVNARPYALALCMSLAAIYSTQLWVKHNSSKYLYLSVLFASLTVYSHFFWGGIIFVQVFYAIKMPSKQRASARQIMFALICLMALLIPTIPQLQQLAEKRNALVLAPLPQFWELLLVFCTPLLTLPLALSFFILAACSPTTESRWQTNLSAKIGEQIWVVFWYFVPATLLFVVSHLSGTSLFIPRYFDWGSAATALLFGLIFSNLRPGMIRTFMPILLVLFCVCVELSSDRFDEDWRGAIKYINTPNHTQNSPILFYSGLIESSNPEWLLNPEMHQQLSAPLQYYATVSPIILLPYSLTTPDSSRYWDSIVRPLLRQQTHLQLLMLHNTIGSSNRRIKKGIDTEVQERIVEAGFRQTEQRFFKRVSVAQFERTSVTKNK